MPILGIDVSHWQGYPNWAQVKASGREFCVLKATEGTYYIDQSFASNRRNAHAAGLIVGFYHFAALSSPAAEAAYFARTVGPLQPGEFIVLDYEPNPVPPGSAVWSKQWLDAARTLLGVAPLIYMNSYTMNVDNWSAVAKDYGLWLAKYDQSTAPVPTKWWPIEAMKQDNDKSLVVGVIGGVDDDVFYGTREQLLAYGMGGSAPAPAPTPTPVQEDDMRLIKTPDGTVWKVTDTEVAPEGNLAAANALAKAWSPIVSVEWAEKDAISADADARVKRYLGNQQNWLLGKQPTAADAPWLWDRVVALSNATQGQAPTIDEAKLAAALLADPTGVQALGKAIAANLQLTPRAGNG